MILPASGLESMRAIVVADSREFQKATDRQRQPIVRPQSSFRSVRLEPKHARKARRELARRQRLLEHLVGAGVARAVNRTAPDEPCHQHDGNAVADAAYLTDQRRARHSRHALIGDQRVEALWIGADGLEGGSAGSEAERHVTAV